jgi:two-component system, cell cycle response regulator
MTDDAGETLELPLVVPAPERRGHADPLTTIRPSDPSLPIGPATEKVLSHPASALYDHATLTVLTELHAGQVFPLDREETVLGRDKNVDVTLEDGSVSRRHAILRRSDSGAFSLTDIGSTNGTFVGARRVDEPVVLVSGDRIQLGANVLLRFTITDEAEAALQRRLYESSTRDALTGVWNRKYLFERLASEVAYARRHASALAVLVVDIDHFKSVNDTLGHLAGDRVLRALASHLARVLRLEDVLARYGGEEFVVLARASSVVDAERLAERLRAAVERLRVPLAHESSTADGPFRPPPHDLGVTVSIGVAYLADAPEDATGTALVAKADTRLYRAKRAGRNRVCATE